MHVSLLQAAHVTMQAVAPGPPLAVTMLGVTHNSLKLKWSPPAFDGGCEPHRYKCMLPFMAIIGVTFLVPDSF